MRLLLDMILFLAAIFLIALLVTGCETTSTTSRFAGDLGECWITNVGSIRCGDPTLDMY